MVYNPCEPLGPRYTHTVMSWPYLTFEAPRQNDFGGHYWDYLARSPKMKSGHDNSFEDMVSVNLLVFNFQMIYKGLIWVMRCEDDSDINGRWGALPSPINSFLHSAVAEVIRLTFVVSEPQRTMNACPLPCLILFVSCCRIMSPEMTRNSSYVVLFSIVRITMYHTWFISISFVNAVREDVRCWVHPGRGRFIATTGHLTMNHRATAFIQEL